MIDKLTKKQEEKIPVYLKKWLDNGYSTEPLNREAAAESVKWLYEFAGKKCPYVLFCDSPMQIQLMIHLLKSGGVLKDNLSTNLCNNLRNNLWNNLRNNLMNNLGVIQWKNLGANISTNQWKNLSINLWNNLSTNIWNNLTANLSTNLWNNISANLWNNLRNNLGSNLWNNLSDDLKNSNLRNNLGANLSTNQWDNLINNLGFNLSTNLFNNLGSNLRTNLWNNLWNNLSDDLKNSKINFNYFFSPSLESYWVGAYDFTLNELFPERKEEFSVFNTKCIDFYKNTFFIIPFEGICFISERPTLIKKIKSDNGQQVLHCDGGPCMAFRDGYEFHALNGIRVSKEISETPWHLLDSNIVLKEKNANVRREIVRKIGTEKLCEDLNAKCIDKSPDGMYELLMLDLKDGRMRPYLKMVNPSIGVYHIEGVNPDCTTVESALMFRNGTSQKPIKLT